MLSVCFQLRQLEIRINNFKRETNKEGQFSLDIKQLVTYLKMLTDLFLQNTGIFFIDLRIDDNNKQILLKNKQK